MGIEIVAPLGKDAALYYETCLLSTVPTFTAAQRIDCARDVTVTIDKDEADASRRAYPGWKDTREGMKGLKLSFELINVVIDDAGSEPDGIEAIRVAFLTGLHDSEAGIALYARSLRNDHAHAVAADAQGGMWGDFLITKFDRAESLGDMQVYSVEANMTLVHGNNPTWINQKPT